MGSVSPFLELEWTFDCGGQDTFPRLDPEQVKKLLPGSLGQCLLEASHCPGRKHEQPVERPMWKGAQACSPHVCFVMQLSVTDAHSLQGLSCFVHFIIFIFYFLISHAQPA